jgi:hypothetical protein
MTSLHSGAALNNSGLISIQSRVYAGSICNTSVTQVCNFDIFDISKAINTCYNIQTCSTKKCFSSSVLSDCSGYFSWNYLVQKNGWRPYLDWVSIIGKLSINNQLKPLHWISWSIFFKIITFPRRSLFKSKHLQPKCWVYIQVGLLTIMQLNCKIIWITNIETYRAESIEGGRNTANS